MKMAPQRRLHRQQQVATREVNSLIRRGLVRDGLASRAPVLAIQVPGRLVKNDQLGDVGKSLTNTTKIFIQVRELIRFPGEVRANVDGMNRRAWMLLGLERQEEGAVEAAAG